MPYDSSLDQSLFSKSWENDSTKLTVSVLSYNNGPKKLQISRENQTSPGDYKFSKLGRMTKEEIENIAPIIQEALGSMD